ncbi:restriction endonuclease subunit S [Ruoffia tabacinasalis]|uniref:Restriction endonuclease subunit S n=1 Tax=Ruoffia tabacinasalis TaxID=87458 RepID=A0A5R9EMD2_9LACT|nr:restriction endonuclease subunit S [Ruoffia tabacinasalis]
MVERVKSYSLSRSVETPNYTGTKYVHYGDIHTKVADKITNETNLPNIVPGDYETLRKGDIILADASEDYQGIATPSIIIDEPISNIVAGLHTIALRPTEIYPLFLYNLFKSTTFRKYGYKTGTGMKVFGISVINLMKFKGYIPSYKEQEKIASILFRIDNAIVLHQRKFDILKDLKEAYLQQIFPEKNHSVPKLRFSNFSNDWKKRVIGDIFIERKQRGAEGELISVTINSGVVKAHELNRKDNSSSNKSNYKRVEVGDIAYNSMRMWQGASGFSKYSGILSPAYTVITPKNDVHSLFFSYYFKNINMIQNFQKYSQGLTSDTWNLKFPSLKEININVPDYSEQKNIANFIVKIDQILLQYENKLSRLEKIKTSLLSKMFI